MVRANRPSAVDFWPSKPAYVTGNEDVIEIDPPSDAFPRRPAVHAQEDESDEEEYEEDGCIERPSRNKNLNPTCVTPVIANLAQDWYRDLVVAGQFCTSGVDAVKKHTLVSNEQYIDFMDQLLGLVHGLPFQPVFDDKDRLNKRDYRNRYEHYHSVVINTLRYTVNDIVILPAGEDGKDPVPNFPKNAPTAKPYAFAGDLFWFGRILSIRRDTGTAHVQWLKHASKTMLQEFAQPQELFMTNSCSDVQLSSFLARCQWRKIPPAQRQDVRTMGHMEFFTSYSFDETESVFRDIPELENDLHRLSRRPGSCQLCITREEEEIQNLEDWYIFPRGDGPPEGFRRGNTSYHCDDAILIRPEASGPCIIGRILDFTEEDEALTLTIQIFERTNDLIRQVEERPAGPYEERHLFLTNTMLEVTPDRILGKVFVLHKRTTAAFRLRNWLETSPTHFYITEAAPSMKRACRGDIDPLPVNDFVFCQTCMEEELDKTERYLRWKQQARTRPLRVFDPFAGCGAFVLGACETRTMKFTHAIDISPSATATLRKNSPGTIVYTQCANKMLEYAVLKTSNPNATLTDLATQEVLPDPPQRGDIDCIISGFPCQPHSTLNMFQRANDLLNELFLNMMSWVEHLRPKYCLFENVPGFIRHKIAATQKDHYTVQGGVEQGGLKFVCAALVALGYQVRFAILQAGYYGTPQTRERFFLLAAKSGLPLPELPPRTHDFPKTSFMGITLANGDVVRPIPTETGIAPLPFVNIADAISDLKRWDWVNPHKVYKRTASSREEEEARSNIEQVRSYYGDECCGIGGAEYEHEPRSAFQAKCRRRPVEELQHVTQCFKDEIIERTCTIPVEIGSNYKNLNNKPLLWDYQMMDASSANARNGYRDTMYVRPRPDETFGTTVTNVRPTAKQAKVLNPWCKRILTVRELARSQGFPDDFAFEATDHKVTTMHRLVGNAVPWPLSEALGRELEKVWYKETKRMTEEAEEMEC